MNKFTVDLSANITDNLLCRAFYLMKLTLAQQLKVPFDKITASRLRFTLEVPNK